MSWCVQTMLQVAEVGVDDVEMPDVCVDGSSVCLVCGDKGSGFHYSVFSCEGCKVRIASFCLFLIFD